MKPGVFLRFEMCRYRRHFRGLQIIELKALYHKKLRMKEAQCYIADWPLFEDESAYSISGS